MLARPHRREAELSSDVDLLEMLTHRPRRRVTRRMLAGQQEAETHVGAQDAHRRYTSVDGPVIRSRTHPTAPPAHRASKLRSPLVTIAWLGHAPRGRAAPRRSCRY